jgi:hypothetical protein
MHKTPFPKKVTFGKWATELPGRHNFPWTWEVDSSRPFLSRGGHLVSLPLAGHRFTGLHSKTKGKDRATKG